MCLLVNTIVSTLANILKDTRKCNPKYTYNRTFQGAGHFFSSMAMGGITQNLKIFPPWPASFNVHWHQCLAADVRRASSDTPHALGKLCVACAAKDSSVGLSSSLC